MGEQYKQEILSEYIANGEAVPRAIFEEAKRLLVKLDNILYNEDGARYLNSRLYHDVQRILEYPTALVREVSDKSTDQQFITDNTIDVIGKCANCGVEFHIHKEGTSNA